MTVMEELRSMFNSSDVDAPLEALCQHDSFETASFGSASDDQDLEMQLTQRDMQMDDLLAPEEGVALAFVDLASAATLWEFDPVGMKDATLLYNATIRTLARQRGGYEALSSYTQDNIGEGTCLFIFRNSVDAMEWCMDVQLALLDLEWPDTLLSHPAAEEKSTEDRTRLFRGPRARMGVHFGHPKAVSDLLSQRASFMGPPVRIAAQITRLAQGGQILMSNALATSVLESSLAGEDDRIISKGRFRLPSHGKSSCTFSSMNSSA